MKNFKEVLKRTFPDFISERLQYLYVTVRARIRRDEKRIPQYIKRGEKDKEKAYIYQISSFGVGLLCAYKWALAEGVRAKKKGRVVIIDYEDSVSVTDKKIGDENLWDMVFEQPCGVSISEGLKMDTVILIRSFTYFVNCPKILKKYNRNYYKKLAKMYCGTFCLKKDLQKAWDMNLTNKFAEKRILGVTLRELFRIMHENNTGWSARHPNEPEINEVIEIIDKKMKECKCEYAFVATEYIDSLEALKVVFGDKLLYTTRQRKRITQDYINDVVRVQEDCSTEEIDEILKRDANGRRGQKNQEYVEEVYGLSRCTCLLGTPSNGMLTALLWNAGKYENVFFFGEKSWEGTSYF